MSILEERELHPCLKIALQMMQSLAEMLGRRVDECLIYSLPLGDAIPVPEEEDGKERHE